MLTAVAIQNIRFRGCANIIIKKLKPMPGIINVTVSVDSGFVSFDHEGDISLRYLLDTLNAMGYPEMGESNSIGTKVQSLISCAKGIFSR